MSKLSRRRFLGSMAGAAGVAAGARFFGLNGRRAEAASVEQPALLVVHFQGQYPAMFSSADTMVGTHGMTAGNVEVLGNGLAIDKPTLGTLSQFAKDHMATIGLYHGIKEHDEAIREMNNRSGKHYTTEIAAAISGTAPIKAAFIGDVFGHENTASVGGVAPQRMTDMGAIIDSLGLGTPAMADPNAPDRVLSAGAIERTQLMSKRLIDANPLSLKGLREAYGPSIELLKKQLAAFSIDEWKTAYQFDGNNYLNYQTPFKNKVAAAELMIRGGASTVFLAQHGDIDDNTGQNRGHAVWDSHGVFDGWMERYIMEVHTIGALRTFCSRMLEDPDRNVVVALVGDFSHDAGTAHNPCLSATIMGKYVKQGTTGRAPNNNGDLPSGSTPGIQQMWAFISDVLKVPQNPFGSNPHALVL